LQRSFGLLLFLLTVLPLAFLAEPVQAQLSVHVWTDKHTYQVGETVRIIVHANMRCEAKLTIIKPDGTIVLYNLGRLEPGEYSLTGMADYPLGQRTVILEARYEYYSARASTYFEVVAPPPTTYSVTVQVSGFPDTYAAAIYLDEKAVGSISGGGSRTFTFDIGATHRVKVDQYVAGSEGTRYYCSSNTRTFSSAGEHVFEYGTEYLLAGRCEALGVGGGYSPIPNGISELVGWHPRDKTLTFKIRLTVDGAAGTQYRFLTLIDDLSGKVLISAGEVQPGPGHDFILRMDRRYNLIARYDTYYYLTVKSPYGNPTGSDWHKAGSTVSFSVSTPVPMDGILGFLGGKYKFRAWSLHELAAWSEKPSDTILMAGPRTVEAVWDADYTIVYGIGGGLIAAVVIVGVVTIVLGRKNYWIRVRDFWAEQIYH